MTRTAVYRMYNDADELLYVGITNNFTRRWDQHARTKSWWPQIRRQTINWYESRAEAEWVELTAIQTESPVHNVKDKPWEPSPGPRQRHNPVTTMILTGLGLGTLRVGDPLVSTDELAEIHKVTPETVKAALNELQKLGCVTITPNGEVCIA